MVVADPWTPATKPFPAITPLAVNAPWLRQRIAPSTNVAIAILSRSKTAKEGMAGNG